MADKIEANYEILGDVQKKFTSLGERADEMRQSLSNGFQPFEDGAWKGEGFDAFYDEMSTEMGPAVKNLIEALKKGATTIGEVAKTLREAEEDARSGMQAVSR